MAALGLFGAAYPALALVNWVQFRVNDFDTGIYGNVLANLARGEGFWSDIHGVNQLGEHFSPILALLIPVAWLGNPALGLLLVESLAAASAMVMLMAMVRRVDRAPGADLRWWFFLALLMLNRPIVSAAGGDFHPSTLAMPLIAGALLALRARRWWVAGVLGALLLGVKENGGLALAGLGLWLGLVERRTRAGVIVTLIGLCAAATITWGVMPIFRAGAWHHAERLGPWAHLPAKAWYLFALGAGLSMLPFFSRRALVAAAPLTMLNLAVTYEPQFGLRHHYDDMSIIFWAAAAIEGMPCAVRFWREQVIARGQWARRALGACAALSALAVASRPAALEIPRRVFSPEDHRSRVREELERLESSGLPAPDALISASSGIGPRFAARRGYRSLQGSADAFAPRPGEVIIMAPTLSTWGMVDTAAWISALDATESATRLRESEVLHVWFVRDGEP